MNQIALIVYNTNDFGGAERRLFRVYNELAKYHACDIIIRGSSDKDAFLDRLRKADCDLSNINNIICLDNNYKCLTFLVTHRKYDVVHFFDSCGFNTVISLLGCFWGFKTIYTLASVHDVKRICDKQMNNEDRILLNKSTIVDVLYPWGLEDIRAKRNNTYLTVGTFTDLEKFQPKAKKKLMVYAAARLEDIKNPGLLVDACKICQSSLRNNGYKVVILGQGVLEQELRRKIIEYGIGDILELHGYQKTSDYFPVTEAVFSLQRIENYPSQVIAEACASGCYLFITDVGSSRKSANLNFATFVESNANDLASAIDNYLAIDTIQKNNIISYSRKYAENYYSITASVAYYQKLIKDTRK